MKLHMMACVKGKDWHPLQDAKVSFPLKLTVKGQDHWTKLFFKSLYMQWLMQSFSGMLLREKINVSQEKRGKHIPSK